MTMTNMHENILPKIAIAGISIKVDHNSTYAYDISNYINDLISNLSTHFIVHELMYVGNAPRDSVTQIEIEILFGPVVDNYFSKEMYRYYEPTEFPFDLCSPCFELLEDFLTNTGAMKQVTLCLNFKKHVLRIVNLNTNIKENLRNILLQLHQITSKQEMAIDGGEIIFPISKIYEEWIWGESENAEFALGNICEDNLNHFQEGFVLFNTHGWGGTPVIMDMKTHEWQTQTFPQLTKKLYWTINDWKISPIKPMLTPHKK